MTPERLQNFKRSPSFGSGRHGFGLYGRHAQCRAVFLLGMAWRQRQRQEQLVFDQFRQAYLSAAGIQRVVTVRPVLRLTAAGPAKPHVHIHRMAQQSKAALTAQTQAGLQPAIHHRESAFLENLQVNVDLTASVRKRCTQARHATQAQSARHHLWRMTRFRQVQKFRQAA